MTTQIEQVGERRAFHVRDISSWDGFEQICHFFIERLGAELVSQNDGPDARVWKIKVNDEAMSVVHDDMIGNFFFPEKSEGERTAKEMAAKLDEQIRVIAELDLPLEVGRLA